jgi:hypothetical protein
MAKKASKKSAEEELKDIASSASLPEGALDDELYDACQKDARLAHEDVCGKTLLDQLTFLWERGYHPVRLREIVKELSEGNESP